MRRVAESLPVAACAIYLLTVLGLPAVIAAPQVPANPINRSAIARRSVVKIESIDSLKKLRSSIKPTASKSVLPLEKTLVRQELVTAYLAPGALAPLAYTTGKGVVLDVLNPVNTQTGSFLVVRGVEWSGDTQKSVAAKDANVALKMSVLGANGYFDTPAQAKFCKLPEGKHTYILTVGITGQSEKMNIYVNGPGDHVIIGFDGAELAKNATPTQQRVMFTLDNAEPTDFLVRAIYLYGSNPNDPYSMTTEYFQYMQLVALD